MSPYILDDKERKKQREHLTAKQLLIVYISSFVLVFLVHLSISITLFNWNNTLSSLGVIILWDLLIAFIILLVFTGSIEVIFILSNI